MLLRYFYDENLAHASYVVGCQATGEAVVVDPMRDIVVYEELAAKENLNIVGALETHIHADFVSGSRELANRFGATLYVSDEGDADWKYQNIDHLNHQLLKDGDQFKIGNLIFDVMHTPGHTPESISFLLTDRGGSADKAMGIFTGDFVFVGDVGRPDLLEKAAGMKGTSEAGAKEMFKSLERFKKLPDYLQVWPAHGAGSACGKALGAVPSTTVGYEKLFNWALQYDDAMAFQKELLDGQPEPPSYFAVMKSVNKTGVELLKNLPKPKVLGSAGELEKLIADGHQVLDLRPSSSFGNGYIPGTINIPFNKSFANWAGWIVDYKEPLYLLLEPESIDLVFEALHSIGIDGVAGYADVSNIIQEVNQLDSYTSVSPDQAKKMIEDGEGNILDVRSQSEYDEGHIEQADHIMVGTLKNRLEEVNANKTVIVQCQSGARSAIATSILKANGIDNLVNLTGGYLKWKEELSV
ncbi:hydroxyacylglutathione hydrolase [Planococcus antarcticus DSM 14505]|uniref:Hydroxyacylglutathione hydrolase n=1 Tax=Planococcus antarcticus DSM 14505 TaxID=1185653 RepID=A0AA87IMJ1_9BACL|nr:MBL fold metallo-hydrolase [Planococcus antarcticus]EIM07518.1 hydroxyacylglutathione hydrolase [Planococcus antarcticus DSM 14505]